LVNDRQADRVVGIDIPLDYEHPWLKFRTSRNPETSHRPALDTSLKRNIGVLLARIQGWRRIVFLDDDVSVPRASDLLRLANLLDRYHAVGLAIHGYPDGYPIGHPDGYPDGYPDNSVVCHAHREAGGGQDTFLGGGALAVDPTRANMSFFPTIYNDDWFFLLKKTGLHNVALTGRAIQREYDPFRRPERAYDEEFGDVMAEGVFWLLDQRRHLSDADSSYWGQWLDGRRRFIEDILARITVRAQESQAPEDRDKCQRIIAALNEAERRRADISPWQCEDYLRTWETDLADWQTMLAQLPSEDSPKRALAHLDLRPVGMNVS
jgi:hypothetical protein